MVATVLTGEAVGGQVTSLKREPRKGRHVIAGRYTLEREIGRGGAGIVHLARDEVLGRAVAIKRIGLLAGTTGHDIARAEREARLAAGINHPHVVSIFDLVKDEDCYWLVMEFVEGRTLTEVIAADGPLAPARAAAIMAQAADALVEANRVGIVHRDVKPSNIMVDGDDHAKLGDFGIARAASDAALTQTGLVTGSPAYLAPEVASGEAATAASDVWSLGATLFHAVVGRAPYDMGANVIGGLYKIVHDDPPRLPDDHPAAALLATMMVKDPARRWPVGRVRDELRRLARDGHGSAVGAEPAPAPVPERPGAVPTERPPSRTRRFPLGWAAALALVLLVGLGAWLLWPGDGERPDTTAGSQPSTQPSASQDPAEEPTESEEAGETSPEPGPTTGSQPKAEIRAFVQDYFSRVTSDPESAYAMLTPQFQQESGGYERYSGFWGTISSATPYDIQVDLQALTTSYTIDYVTASGRTTTQAVQLQLQRQGEDYLIAGES